MQAQRKARVDSLEVYASDDLRVNINSLCLFILPERRKRPMDAMGTARDLLNTKLGIFDANLKG